MNNANKITAALKGEDSSVVITIDENSTLFADGQELQFLCWAGPSVDGSEDDTYSMADYFDINGDYRGPDQHGVYPMCSLA
jgi:hypothetical protein